MLHYSFPKPTIKIDKPVIHIYSVNVPLLWSEDLPNEALNVPQLWFEDLPNEAFHSDTTTLLNSGGETEERDGNLLYMG